MQNIYFIGSWELLASFITYFSFNSWWLFVSCFLEKASLTQANIFFRQWNTHFSNQWPLLCYILLQLLILEATQIAMRSLGPMPNNFTILRWQSGNKWVLEFIHHFTHSSLTVLISLTWLSCFHGKKCMDHSHLIALNVSTLLMKFSFFH